MNDQLRLVSCYCGQHSIGTIAVGSHLVAIVGSTDVGLKNMYRIPKELDLSPVVGEFTTQVRVGQFDLQFTFGAVNFAVQSPVNLFREGKLVAHWEEGK